MSELRSRLERARDGQVPSPGAYERMLERAHSRGRRRRAAVATILVLSVAIGLASLASALQPARGARTLAAPATVTGYPVPGASALDAAGLGHIRPMIAPEGSGLFSPAGSIIGAGALSIGLFASFGLILHARASTYRIPRAA